MTQALKEADWIQDVEGIQDGDVFEFFAPCGYCNFYCTVLHVSETKVITLSRRGLEKLPKILGVRGQYRWDQRLREMREIGTDQQLSFFDFSHVRILKGINIEGARKYQSLLQKKDVLKILGLKEEEWLQQRLEVQQTFELLMEKALELGSNSMLKTEELVVLLFQVINLPIIPAQIETFTAAINAIKQR
jgi:hypothetical protein